MIYRVCKKLPGENFNPFFILDIDDRRFSNDGHHAYYRFFHLIESFHECKDPEWTINTVQFKVLFSGTREEIIRKYVEYLI